MGIRHLLHVCLRFPRQISFAVLSPLLNSRKNKIRSTGYSINPKKEIIMKKIALYAGSILMTLAMASCQKAESPVLGVEDPTSDETAVKEFGETVFTLSAGIDQTKTALDGVKVLWEVGDQIVVNGVTSKPLTQGGASANFEFDAVIDAPFNAVYPASAYVDGSYEAGETLVNLPKTQTYVKDSFDPAAALMVGQGESSVIFSHLMSYVKVSVGGADAKSIRVRSNLVTGNTDKKGFGRQPMSGKFPLAYDGSALKGAVNNASEVTVNFDTPLAAGTPVIIAVPAQTYTRGINIFVVTSDDQCFEKVAKNEFVAKAGSIFPTTIVASNLAQYQGPGIYSVGDWNTFAAIESLGCNDGEFADGEGVVNVYADLSDETLQRFGGVEEGEKIVDFAGSIDGHGHYLEQTSQSVSFFTYISGTVKNLTFKSPARKAATVNGWGTAVLALDLNSGANIENVTIDAKIEVEPNADTQYYGMCRYIKEGATVKGCTVKVDYTLPAFTTDKDTYICSYAYSNAGTIQNCINSGNVVIAESITAPKTLIAPFFRNTATIDGFVNLGNITVKAINETKAAGVCMWGGGTFRNCVNGKEGDDTKGNIELTIVPTENGKTFDIAGISVYASAEQKKNAGDYYTNTNYGKLTWHKTNDKIVYRSAVGGIVADLQYGVYGGAAGSHTYTTMDGCVNRGYLTMVEDNFSGTSVGSFMGGIAGIAGLNTSGTTSGALVLTKPTSELNGNYLVIRTNCKNFGTLEMASAIGSESTASVTGARQWGVGGIAGIAYGMGPVGDTPAHPAIVRGQQNGVIKVGSSVQGNTCAGGIVGIACYTKVEQATANVTYEATSYKTKGTDPKYRGMIAGTIGLVLKDSEVASGVNATLTDNTGLVPSSSQSDTGVYVGYAGITGAKSVNKDTTTKTHAVTVSGASTYNGAAVTTDVIYGAGTKTIK